MPRTRIGKVMCALEWYCDGFVSGPYCWCLVKMALRGNAW